MEWIGLVSRWLHVGTAIVLVGGAVFNRFVLMPAAANLPDEPRNDLQRRVVATWKRFVMIGIALFLLTGFYNYLVVMRPEHAGDKLYHMLMGIKILLSLVLFILASALVGRAPGLETFRRNARLWLGVMLLLAAAIVAIAGYLKVRPLGDWPPQHAGGSEPAGLERG